MDGDLHEALFWEAGEGGLIDCRLCPRRCRIAPGRTGTCGVRSNRDGRLFALTYGRLSAVHVDPIEKKPLFHFMPGTEILSVGAAGCNLSCRFCQNWEMSKASPDALPAADYPPEAVVAAAVRHGCPSIAFTYNEPTVFAEYVIDTSALAHEAGLRTVMVTNGFIERDALARVYEHIDAANVDLKAFDDEFYRTWTGGSLAPVLDALVAMKAMGVWVELTTLLIEGLNTDEGRLRAQCRWIRENLGPDVPIHFSAFHPDYKMLDRRPTRPEALRLARDVAREEGLRFAYEGNVRSDGSNTYCPRCQRLLVRREWHEVVEDALAGDCRCTCGEPIPMRR